MLPTNPGGHAAFQDTFVSDFLKFYPDPFSLPKSTWDYIVQFWFLDLSQTDSIMRDCYSVFGPQPRLPSCMLRSYLLALKLKVSSITLWCRMLRETPLYAILSGFPFGDTPGVGTFYDFFSRIWKHDSDNLSPKDRFPKMKPPKGKKKGEKTPCDSSSTASKLLPLLQRWHLKPQNPFCLHPAAHRRDAAGTAGKSRERGCLMAARLFTALRERRNRNRRQRKKRAVSKKKFIALLEAALRCAELDVTGLSLMDDNTVQITFKGGGTRRVNIEADSYGAVIVDVMKHVF